jgi:uncharacterized membrane-anchored protein
MLNFLLTLLVALLIGGIIVGICFWLINMFVANPQFNKGLKGVIVLIVLVIILIYLFGGGDIGTIHSGTHKFLN